MFHRETGVFKTSYASDMALYPLPIARGTIVALLILFVVIVPLVFGEYFLSIINLVLISIVGALGLNILVGYTGQISIGHAAFMSVGNTRPEVPTKVAMPRPAAQVRSAGPSKASMHSRKAAERSP